jgi:hypothetical protein
MGRLAALGLVDPSVLALDLLDQQPDVLVSLRGVHVHQLAERPVEVIGQEEDLATQAVTV